MAPARSSRVRRPIRVLRAGFADRPALDEAVSNALLRRAAAGLDPETLRLRRLGSVVAFGSEDRRSPGFAAAVGAAAAIGVGSILRLVGGRATVFLPQVLVFSWTVPGPTAISGIAERFRMLSEIMAAAFRDLGIDARVGEVAGEYCPGRYSVNARGRAKLMGVGQRVVARAAHVGGVVAVEDALSMRRVLVPVYEALGWPFDPATVGSLKDENPDITWSDVERAVLDRLSERFRVDHGTLEPGILEAARPLEARHRI